MKNVFIICSYLVLTLNVFAQNALDKEEITDVVNKYLSGVTNYDINLLRQAFHPDAKLFYVDKQGNLQQKTQYEWYKHIKAPTRAMERKNEIVSIDITGTVALAKTKSEFAKFTYTHYLSLVKAYGQWLIVNKVYYREDMN